MPMFAQSGGDVETIVNNRYYLVIALSKLNVFNQIVDGGDAKVWVTIEWGGIQKTSRTFMRA